MKDEGAAQKRRSHTPIRLKLEDEEPERADERKPCNQHRAYFFIEGSIVFTSRSISLQQDETCTDRRSLCSKVTDERGDTHLSASWSSFNRTARDKHHRMKRIYPNVVAARAVGGSVRRKQPHTQ